MKTSLRVAVVGCGYWGPNLVRNLVATPGVEVGCVCDLEQTRLDDVARRFQVGRTTTEFERVLDDRGIDAVVLATPIPTHRRLGEAVLHAGKHLWVEKPLAGSVADAEALVNLARDKNLRLFVDHTFLYTPAVRKIRELIASGELGDVLYLDSVRTNLGLFQEDANVLWDLGPHDLSIARYALGRSPSAISAVGVRHYDGAAENMAYLTLRYDEKLLAHFHLNWLAPVKIRRTMIGGTRRMLVYDDVEAVEKIKIYNEGVRVEPGDLESRRRTLVSYRTGDVWSPHLEQTEALSAAVHDFATAIEEGRATGSDGEAGLEIVRMLAAAQQSMDQDGGFVEI